ncbi:MAG TPA: hypothetical protein VK892_10010 [Pyrinomonadaceae bacterium]|nr:hypothetical protein [Pyrinomonadaceae bacterium]
MSSINGKFPGTRRVMQVFGGHGAQNQNHQREQNQQNNQNAGFSTADSFTGSPVPQRNVFVDSGNFVPNAGANYYKTAQWAVETAKPNDNVKIIAELHGTVSDGTAVQINIIHNLSPTQKSVYETISGVINGGVVSATWQAKIKGPDSKQGFLTFMIFGGKASRESTNALRLV